MQAEEILTQARTGQPPQGWIVFPLSRNKVVLGIVGWALGILLGLGLFAAAASVVIPFNYEHGFVSALFTTLLLGVFLFIGLGSVWALIVDVQRLLDADSHILVITPEEFVKQERSRIISVPLVNVRHVTARGTPPPDRTPLPESSVRHIPGVGERAVGMFLGRGFTPAGQRWRRTRMRTPTSLAFVDTRTDREVIVVTDGSYGDPFLIAALLKQYAASVQQVARQGEHFIERK